MSEQASTPITYSFRAEAQADFDDFVGRAISAGMALSIVEVQRAMPLNELKVEIATRAPLEWLQSIMREVEDGHLMLQTLRPLPLSANDLKRNYDLDD